MLPSQAGQPEARQDDAGSTASSASSGPSRLRHRRHRSEGADPLAVGCARRASEAEDVFLEENERLQSQDADDALELAMVNTLWKRGVSCDTGLQIGVGCRGRAAQPAGRAGRPRLWTRWNTWLGAKFSRGLSEEGGGSCSASMSPCSSIASIVDSLEGFSGLDELPASLFEDVSLPLKVSGGTATFFRVSYREGARPATSCAEQLVGKDITHAKHEVEFYAKLRSASERWPSWAEFAKQAMRSPGFAQLDCCVQVDDLGKSMCETRPLLLLENLQAGFQKLRLIDVKLGAETSVAGWMGKSRLHAWKNACIDQRTNSAVEGFRLEGMDNPPQALQDRIDELVAHSQTKGQTKLVSAKAIRRFALQRLRACDFLADWLDLSELGSGAELRAHGAVWSALKCLDGLRQAVAGVPVPQQWIGSSLALGLEASAESAAPRVVAKVFDWGRSELGTVEDYSRLHAEEKKERLLHWRQYARAVARFQWELYRIAAHRCCCPSWVAIVFELRSEPLRVVRAALSGASEGVVLGIGLHELPAGGLASDHSSLALQLVARWSNPAEDQRSSPGKLHATMTLPKGATRGTSSVSLKLRCCTHLRGAEALACDGLVFVRAVAFERLEDARRHAQAHLAGYPEPQPNGRACVQRGAPGRAQGESLIFQESRPMEFVALGSAAAAEAQKRLQAALPARLREGPGGRTRSTWPSLLPPPVGAVALALGAQVAAEAEAASSKFCEGLFPWTQEGGQCPAHWL